MSWISEIFFFWDIQIVQKDKTPLGQLWSQLHVDLSVIGLLLSALGKLM